jgi:hypothetical protein
LLHLCIETGVVHNLGLSKHFVQLGIWGCRESDVNVLRELCKQLLQGRDAERAAKLEFERQVTRLQAEVDQISKFVILRDSEMKE